MAFKYQPLDQSKQQIRLLRVKPGSGHGQQAAVCKLQTFNFVPEALGDNKNLPKYTALSYTWGTEKNLKTITLDGKSFQIRQNLCDFLRSTVEELQHTWIWIDQLCIDQSNTSERSNQVSIMADIYSKADEVIVWLGTLEEGTKDAFVALDFVKWAQADRKTRVAEKLAYEDRSEGPSSILALRRYVPWPESNKHKRDRQTIRKSRKVVGSKPYWTRMWIVQEFILAKRLRIRWGSHWLPWENMAERIIPGERKRTSELDDLGIWRLPPKVRLLRDMRQAIVDNLKSEKARLQEVIYSFYPHDCLDPRDHVYAVLGIMSKYGNDTCRDIIEVNYDKEVKEVFLDAVYAMVRTSEGARKDKSNPTLAYMSLLEFLLTCNGLAGRMLGVRDGLAERVLGKNKNRLRDVGYKEQGESSEERIIVPSWDQAEKMKDMYRKVLLNYHVDWRDYYVEPELPARNITRGRHEKFTGS